MVTEDETLRHKQHDKMWRDIYIGDGKDNPPMTVRMAAQETISESIQHYARMILATLIGTMATVVVSLVTYLLTKH